MNDLRIFENSEFGELRVLEMEGKPYFIATEIAKMLGYSNPHDAISRHCRWVVKHEVPHPQSKTKTLEVNVIPEGDLYRLITHSELPSAEKFESWVFDEVLPSIRKHGLYATPQTIENMINNPEFGIKLLTTLKEEREKRIQLESEKVLLVEQKETLKTQLDKSTKYFTIKRVAALNRIDWKELSWKKLKNESNYMQIPVKKIFDANYGKVNSYHIDVWRNVYPGLKYESA